MTPAHRPEPGVRARMARAGERRLWRAPIAIFPVVAMLLSGGAAFANALPPMPGEPLPTGQDLSPLDLALEDQPDGQLWLVLRYVAPRIAREGGDLGYDAVAGDLDALCDGPGRTAAQWAADQGEPVDQLVVVLVDRPFERGVVDPEATSFIAAYRLEAGGCVWQ